MLFHEGYLTSLRERRQTEFKRDKGDVNSEPQVGDVVLVKDQGPRAGWRYGVVTEQHFSKDGLIRAVDVRIPNGHILSRPPKLLYPLECPGTGPDTEDGALTGDQVGTEPIIEDDVTTGEPPGDHMSHGGDDTTHSDELRRPIPRAAKEKARAAIRGCLVDDQSVETTTLVVGVSRSERFPINFSDVVQGVQLLGDKDCSMMW